MAPVLLFVALAASVPTMDLPRICRGEQTGIAADQRAQVYQSCMRDEQAAREALKKEWMQIPAAARATCAELGREIQSYVEVLTCIEVTMGSNSPAWKSQELPAGPSSPAPIQPGAPDVTISPGHPVH
ncbi:hypothetical protein [Methylocapsa sp. S129]|uniref:hypothetical protein n=1 Tax=Methylocapsa sp. S129 TaxID=1641869 RepID=UPI00131AB9EF|nr:hypothetical protein [Methylocapsa sp. S129]